MHNMFDENAEHGKFLIFVTPLALNVHVCFAFLTDRQTDLQTEGWTDRDKHNYSVF